MNLSSQMLSQNQISADSFEILAVNDSFVDQRTEGQSIYEAAGISAAQIVAAVTRLSNQFNKKEIS